MAFYVIIVNLNYYRKKSDANKTAKSVKKISASKSPNLSKKESTPPENAGAGSKPRSGSYNLMPAPDDQMVRSNEDLESVHIINIFANQSLRTFCYMLYITIGICILVHEL